MWKYFAHPIAGPRQIWAGDRWRQLAGEILLLAAFVLTSSWLIER